MHWLGLARSAFARNEQADVSRRHGPRDVHVRSTRSARRRRRRTASLLQCAHSINLGNDFGVVLYWASSTVVQDYDSKGTRLGTYTVLRLTLSSTVSVRLKRQVVQIRTLPVITKRRAAPAS